MTPRRTPEDWIAALGMALLALITMANVVVRYLTDHSFAWTEEFSVFLLVLTTLAGASAAMLQERHIRIEFVLERGSPARRRALATGGAGLAIIFFLAFAVLSGRMAWDDFRYAETTMGLGLPRWWYTAWVPALALVIALRGAQALRRLWRDG